MMAPTRPFSTQSMQNHESRHPHAPKSVKLQLPGKWALPWCWLALTVSLPAIAEDSLIDQFRLLSTQGREVVLMPAAETSLQMPSALGAIDARSYDTVSRRVHIVEFDGQTYRASTPLQGPSSRIAFDPSRRRFDQLLPSIRVELADGVAAHVLAEAIGGGKVTLFESLGFAIIDLPPALHPVEALARVAALAEPPSASIRLRGPRIELR